MSLSSVQEQSEAVNHLLSNMTSKKVKQLVLIKTSKQYLTRLVRALEQKAGQHDKFLRYSAGNQQAHPLSVVSVIVACKG